MNGRAAGHAGSESRKNMSSFHRQSSQRAERMNLADGSTSERADESRRNDPPATERVSRASACAYILPFLRFLAARRAPSPALFFPFSCSSTSVSGLRRSPRSSVDAVIVRCSSRCIVIRDNDFIKIHTGVPGWLTACVRACVRAPRSVPGREETHGICESRRGGAKNADRGADDLRGKYSLGSGDTAMRERENARERITLKKGDEEEREAEWSGARRSAAFEHTEADARGLSRDALEYLGSGQALGEIRGSFRSRPINPCCNYFPIFELREKRATRRRLFDRFTENCQRRF